MSEVVKTRRSVLGAGRGAGSELAVSLPADPGSPRQADEARSARLRFSVVVVEDPAALTEYVAAWQALADSALEPNVFYEPWMLVPAIQAFGGGGDLRFVFVQAFDPANPAAPPILCGFFPLERKRRYGGLAMPLPFTSLALWKHPFCYLCTPLLRAEYASECLAAFFDWLAAGSHGSTLLEFGFTAGDGPFWQALGDHIERHAKPYYVSVSFLRALFRSTGDTEAYLRASVPSSRMRELRRHERRLADAGPLEYRALEPGDDVDAWIGEFLHVESISWKGKGGRALVLDAFSREYFETIAKAAYRRGQLMMLALRLDGRAIAHKCNFVSGAGSFAFKIAFDEAHARHSPGVLLELENIRLLHARPQIRWMDSCADASHPMLDRLWPGRRTIQNVVVGTGRPLGDWVVAAIPLLRLLKRKLSRGAPRAQGPKRASG